jgi:transcriptional regulator with XRE-family HTH domain
LDERSIIEKIKRIRQNNNITLKDLAEKTDLTVGYLSRIENGNKVPPIPTLDRIAQGLNTDISFLFLDESKSKNPSIVVVRQDDYKDNILSLESRPEEVSKRYRYIPLVQDKLGKNMQPYMVVLSFDIYERLQHAGEEFHYVLKGDLEFFYGSEKYTLTKGDCVYFDGHIPHSARSIGDEEAEVLMVLYPYKKLDAT